MNKPQVPAIFQAHIGTWQGNYIKSDINGHFLSSFIGKFTVKIEGVNYAQINEYEFPDGRQSKLEFNGKFEDGILKLGSPSYGDFSAIAWDSGENTIIFIATKTQDHNLIKFVETINLVNPHYRVRMTQQFTNHQFSGINFIAEIKIN
jgi:hypothetical protein